jgi:AraC family transcriptional regulator of adaptative response/methylated-DNA-[protein]-cysteine methyltransferase
MRSTGNNNDASGAVETRTRGSTARFLWREHDRHLLQTLVRPGGRSANVVFFDTPKTAEKQGFRACQRCKPGSVTEKDRRSRWFTSCQLVEESRRKRIAGISGRRNRNEPAPSTADIQEHPGITPKQYATALKVNFKEQVQRGEDVTSAMYEAGSVRAARL